MDFWSRLLSHTSLSSNTSRETAARDPAKRLHRFEREYGQLLQIWRNSSNLSRDFEAAEKLEIRLHELTTILSDESRRPLPHPCIQFASIKQIYVPIAKVATTSYNEWIIKEAVHFFATLIESEEEAFVENHNFSSSLTTLLVRITGQNSVRLGRDTEVKVVELAFNITTKMRLQPHILDVWFRRLPLFYILMDYIQHEGRVGDFARTGLLYIIETASSSVALEQWIVESDLSTLMATGLGALYSQLSRKLHPTSNYEIVASCAPEFQAHLDTFLSHLLFWQDVLNHCRSVEVKSTLLEHFQVIFLQQLLYPSLLESSDIDGGSSVAVITYLRRILESLDHPDMINLILHYLLALPDADTSRTPAGESTSVSAARKRKSMDLATMLAEKQDPWDPLLFNLVDLALACLRSHSQQTIHVTLQLISSILKRHHRYAVLTLLRTESLHAPASTHRTSGAHDQEVEYLMTLAGSIGGQDNFDEVYENVLRDAMTRLEAHSCSLKLVAPKVSTANHDLPAIPDSLPGAPPDVSTHTLQPDDPLLVTLLDILETFFVNPVDTNLSVTETLTDLAICGYMGVEGWLVRHPKHYSYEDEDDEAEAEETALALAASSAGPESPEYEVAQRLLAQRRCRRRPRWVASSLPRLLTVLKKLSEQLAGYRETIPRFDDLLQQRREAFQTADAAPVLPFHTPQQPQPQPQSQQQRRGDSQGPGSYNTPDRGSMDDPRGDSPARPSGLEGFAQRLLSELGTPSRTGSPRPGSGAAPREFPLNYDKHPGAAGRAAGEDGGEDGVPFNLGKAVQEQGSGPGQQPEAGGAGKQKGERGQEEEEEETTGESGEDDEMAEAFTPLEDSMVSVSHVLTNALILQSFLMELAGIVQVRAGLFNEVRFV
ncbi:unnamed protein product [Parascedosporium putredinis]|uniref:Retinoic acid induced 16-like protein n=1 Tax=Parascedosporium putredinis TaxID=1442378 RepID=A0A9P1M7S9_9PEZI|nr:unnamed protein product [Parascedosporium putredinis]CAI7991127.1 unnamed protein product [Parascedosporium putredinis]